VRGQSALHAAALRRLVSELGLRLGLGWGGVGCQPAEAVRACAYRPGQRTKLGAKRLGWCRDTAHPPSPLTPLLPHPAFAALPPQLPSNLTLSTPPPFAAAASAPAHARTSPSSSPSLSPRPPAYHPPPQPPPAL
jgi:hypothetical protein